MNILSIQSSVAYGHVGNSSAVFPLQRLGAEVWPIATVQFSNHPGYGAHTGAITPPDTIRALIDGIEARGVLRNCNALLTGYLGDPGTGACLLHAAARLRAANPAGLWCCDPVIGDDEPGIYVRAGIKEFFRDQAVPLADVLTPNQFELAQLTGLPCQTLDQAKVAVVQLQDRMPDRGPRAILVTSLQTDDTPDDSIDMLAAGMHGMHRLRTPRLEISVNGAGDAVAALFLFHILRTGSAASAMEHAASSVYGLLRRTQEAGSRELLIVAAQEQFLNPEQHFVSQPC